LESNPLPPPAEAANGGRGMTCELCEDPLNEAETRACEDGPKLHTICRNIAIAVNVAELRINSPLPSE